MKIHKLQQVEVVADYICDVCGESCSRDERIDPPHAAEYATLSAEWGFWSKGKDLTWHECHLCEPCFDKVKRFIEEDLKGTVRTGDLRG